jgi:hypothetical protein
MTVNVVPQASLFLNVCAYGRLGDRDKNDWGVKLMHLRFKEIVAEHGGTFEGSNKGRQSLRDEKNRGPLYELQAWFRKHPPEQIYEQLSKAGFSVVRGGRQ